MNAYLHRSEDRGHVNLGWLNSKHSFSFGSWYNPKYMGVSTLRVINDDHIAGQQGFGTHPHDNMEILTCVLKGTISHQDSMGNKGDIKAGEWQLMSAGSGIQHSEMNQYDEQVHLLQIWIHSDEPDATPTYQQISCDVQQAPNQWHVIAGPNDNAQMHLRQQAEVKSAFLQQDHRLNVQSVHGLNYVHVINGAVEIGEHLVKAGDALLFRDVAEIKALNDAQMIWFDLTDNA
ncbi:pirin-like bicupin family protein [uncultured Acinetobacter sp.]|uniref:pirin family protein n=1 Tax=uncultured Acinetobacter sp. TaxID=165433 RepID=UPI0026165263|nr:pirin-like bicupin family protein [uncultured Acinetobacter sp.]